MEGALLAGYRYAGVKKEPNKSSLGALTLVVSERRSAGAHRGAGSGVGTAVESIDHAVGVAVARAAAQVDDRSRRRLVGGPQALHLRA